MRVSTCAIRGLYNIICRDPDTAEGGLDPGFFIEDKIDLDFLETSGIDRKVQIEYLGTDSWGETKMGRGGKVKRTFNVNIRIGYWFGDDRVNTQMAIADDEQRIGRSLLQWDNWPECENGCVMGYMPDSSRFERLDENRGVNNITVEITVHGSD